MVERDKTVNKDTILNKSITEHILNASKILTSQTKRRGILFMGSVGTGKTTLFRAVFRAIQELAKDERLEYDQRNGIGQIRQISAIDLNLLSVNQEKNSIEQLKQIKDKRYLFIDDLGCEPSEVKHYGNISTPMIDLICQRYEMQLYTVITTNLDMPTIMERYGERFADRIKEQYAILVFNGNSYRK